MIYIVSTPIGNLEDITLRALRILREADVIIAEDTRHTGLLLKYFEVAHKPMLSLYEEVEGQKLSDLLALVKSDQKVVLLSDAGTPLVSDPGYKLVREAIRSGVRVESVPGPTALISALTVSGLPPDKFLFLGYPPEKEGHYRDLISTIKQVDYATIIFYVSPYKLLKNLAVMRDELGDIEIVVARELTKIHEEVWRGKVSEAVKRFSKPRGEFVVLFHL